MDAALHGGESSNQQGVSSDRRVYQKAALLVHIAEDGNGLPEEILELPNSETAKLYCIFIRFNIIRKLNCFALITLNFFEKPLWCSSVSKISCGNRDYYYLGELPYLTNAGSLAYKGVTLTILVVHTLFPILYKGGQLYWRSHVNKLKAIALLILAADLIVDILNLSPVAIYSFPLRIAPFFRVVFFILSIRDLQDSLIILAGMLGTYLNVMILSLLFLLISSWLAQVIFEDTQQGTTIFVSYRATLYQMFLLFSTSNNPDVWIPAYKSSRWSSLFFCSLCPSGCLLFHKLDSCCCLAKQVGKKDRMKTRILGRAFNLIDENAVGTLDKNQCFQLFEELNKYRTLAKISKQDFELIFDALDDSHDSKIDASEFNDLCNAIDIKFQEEKFPFYNSSFSEILRDCVRSKMFERVVVFLLLLNLASIIIERMLDTKNNSGQKFMQKVELVFGWIYVIEMALKVYAYGFENYWRNSQNRFDFIVTWFIVIGETITFISPKELEFTSNGEWIRYLLIARMIRPIRLITRVHSFHAFGSVFLTVIPSLMPYLGTIFCVMCIYCSMGIQIFGGKVNAGNPDVPSTDLADNDYLLFNFNDYPNGMVTLFNLLVMGNWQVWMQDYGMLTGSSWTYVYFISFYLITVLLILNLIVAFVLEAFFAEIDLEGSEQEEEEEHREETGGRRRCAIGTKTRNRRTDILLHQMLSAELHEIQRRSEP
ncbi:unnamed protein product [Lactuca virosa]|uniref:EF-hand domain-containing protein n=1 Tax=Lactuca virosa TaxID=75947 RepID=A0AAU9MDK4_9ASTR|nr:unnamed protein product [Lactuca virosa]